MLSNGAIIFNKKYGASEIHIIWIYHYLKAFYEVARNGGIYAK